MPRVLNALPIGSRADWAQFNHKVSGTVFDT